MFKLLRYLIVLALLYSGQQVAAQSSMPDTTCVGVTKHYKVNDASVPSTYTWTINGVVQATTTNEIVVTWSTPGTYLLAVVEHSNAGCDGDPQTGVVYVRPLNTFMADTTVCANKLPLNWHDHVFTGAGTIIDTVAGINTCDTIRTLHLFVNPLLTLTTNAEVCANQLPFIWKGNSYTAAGTYIDTLQATVGCDTIATLHLTVNPLIKKSTLATICSDQLPYIWNGNAYNSSGSYVDTIHSVNSCDTIATLNLAVQAPLPGMRYPTVNAPLNTNFQLSARTFGNGTVYTWKPQVGLNNYNIQNPIFKYIATTEYQIQITPPNGCLFTDTLLVKVPPITCDVYVPKAWSPNGDGHNDKLFPMPANLTEIRYFKVFNRWGELVFETKTLGDGWDGIYKGQLQALDTYTWICEAVCLDGKIVQKTGKSVLLR